MEHEELLPLLRQVAMGEQAAFEQLYEKTCGQLFAVALKMLKNKESAEEALQEAFIRVWYKADYYKEGQGTVLTWMVSIVRYRALDMIRSRKVRKEDTFEDVIQIADQVEDGLPLQQVLDTTDSRLHKCLEELDFQQKQAINLAYFQGLSHSEVVSYLDSPLGTIKSWIRRGLISLQRCIGL